jgi:lipoyl(octanoyl) transferase
MRIIDLGLVEYADAYALQRQIHAGVRSGKIPSTLILCRHNPVITVGRSAAIGELRHPRRQIEQRGIRVVDTDRGGRTTYHGPGQQVVYAVCDLRPRGNDLHRFLRSLEELMLGVLTDTGIAGERREGKTGVWIGEKKIASVGIGVAGWVSYHGASVNVKRDDLDGFRSIRPCGMDIEMTCAEDVLGRDVRMDEFTDAITRRMSDEKSCLA